MLPPKFLFGLAFRRCCHHQSRGNDAQIVEFAGVCFDNNSGNDWLVSYTTHADDSFEVIITYIDQNNA